MREWIVCDEDGHTRMQRESKGEQAARINDW